MIHLCDSLDLDYVSEGDTKAFRTHCNSESVLDSPACPAVSTCIVYTKTIPRANSICTKAAMRPQVPPVCTTGRTWYARVVQAGRPSCTAISGDVHSPAYVVGSHRLVVLTPFTCRLEALQRYLATSCMELGKTVGRKKQLLLSWSYCWDADSKFTRQLLLTTVIESEKAEPFV
jgi:hypothetical protein